MVALAPPVVPARSPLALLRARAPLRIVQRGEDLFRAGAVLSLQRRGRRALARVQGSGEAVYEVELSWTDGRAAAACSCPYEWSDVCKHAVAVAIALEPQAPAPVAAPREDPVVAAAASEREHRAKYARAEKLVLSRGPRSWPGAFKVRSERSRREYDVLLPAPDFSFCSCPDFRTNELGTCKHVELARRRGTGLAARAPAPLAVLASRDTRGAVLDPLSDIRFYLPRAPVGALARLVDADGFVRRSPPESRPATARQLRRLIAGWDALRVRPEVLELLDEVEGEARGRAAMERFEAQVRASLRGEGAAPAAWKRLMAALRLQLHPYQVDGVLFVARTRRALLGDDMGLGKTIQSVAGVRLLMELGEVRRALVVCPASLKHQWSREIAKVLGEAAPAAVVEGGRREREALYRTSRAPFLVMNYEVLIKDLPLVRALAPDVVVLDEAQRIKNWNTKTAKAVKALASPRALVLTGTPLENRLGELNSVAEYLEPRLLGPMWRLLPEFAETTVEDKRPRVVGFRGLGLLRERLARHFLRRERSRVLSQLPSRTEQVVPVPFTREQQQPHQDHAANAARIAAKKHLTEVDILRLMAELASMRMIANGMLLYEWEKVEATVRKGQLPPELLSRHPSPKLVEFAGVLEQLLAQPGTKVVVFSGWERMLRLAAAAAREVLEEAGARPIFFHGGLSSRERAEAISDFHDDPQARVFFSTDAGGVGLNLQEAANTLVHLEVPWNPAVLEQRVGRVHRMGQKRPVQVVSLISEGCIEARIARVVEQKRALFDGLFRGDSDELRYDESARTGLVERVREILGAADGQPAAPPLPDVGLVEQRRAVDETIRQARDGVAELSPAQPLPAGAPPPPAPAAPPSGAEATGPELPTPGRPGPEVRFDLGAAAQGLLGLLGAPASLAPASLPVTVRREEGRLKLELPDVPEEAWSHLQAFVAALGGAAGPGAPRS